MTPPPGLELAKTVLLVRFAHCAGCDLSARPLSGCAFTARGRFASLTVSLAAGSAVVRFRWNLTGREIAERFHAAARTRTWDNLGNNQVLYQLSYGGSVLR